jgi:hypothetical protein
MNATQSTATRQPGSQPPTRVRLEHQAGGAGFVEGPVVETMGPVRTAVNGTLVHGSALAVE